MRNHIGGQTLRRLVVVAFLVLGAHHGLAFEEHTEFNAVIHWNRIATEITPVDPGPVIDSRALAILHAAVHDAVNGIDRQYEPYTADLSAPGASVDAAVARAARDARTTLAPGQRERVEREYVAALARVPDDPAKDAGLFLGKTAARANLDRRSNDGITPGPWSPQDGPITEPVYVPTGAPGDYDFTPPFDAPPFGPIALFPGWGRLAPFAIDVTDLDTTRCNGTI